MPVVYPSPEPCTECAAPAPAVAVVDDEYVIVRVICDALDHFDIPAVACAHGHSAYDCIRELQPKIVILDVMMPEVDGVTLFQRLKADGLTQQMCVIFCTANLPMLQAKLPNFEELAAAVITKPFELKSLVKCVQTLLAGACA
jgi:two-component system OmpR family response regulator